MSGEVGNWGAQTGENPETCGLHHGRKQKVRKELEEGSFVRACGRCQYFEEMLAILS